MRTDAPLSPHSVQELGALLKRRGFIWPSFEIYGGIAGLYDLGPMGSLLKDNIESAWKRRFLVEEGFLLVDCPNITPEIVFRHSGHLDRFSDLITQCSDCGNAFRADHLPSPPGTTPEEIPSAIARGEVPCPHCGGVLSRPEEFNLMFSTSIGPGRDKRAFLRPETAQNIFVDFALLYRHARGKVPFGVAQIGKGFRNEISPRQGLIRLREFHMAEGEYFFDPIVPSYAPFSRYRDLPVRLVAATDPGATVEITLGDAVDSGIVSSEVLAHFIGVTSSFATSIGIPLTITRFRQHQRSEMAHYARDCWDLEVLTSYGWIEMVGIADRSAYDLSQHAKGSGQELYAIRRFDEPRTVRGTRTVPDMKALGPVFRGDARSVGEALSAMDPDEVRTSLEDAGFVLLTVGGIERKVEGSMFRIEEFEEKVHQERFVPNVIEPSFGIDRLMVAVLESSYDEDESRMEEDDEGDKAPYRVLRLRPAIAPIKFGVFPLLNRPELVQRSQMIDAGLRSMGISTYHDPSGSIGRRYARMDEVGTPFCITFDHDSLEDGRVTIRERDSGKQVRVPEADLRSVCRDLSGEIMAFDDLKGSPG